MADINEIITLGIGTPSDIKHFILLGLNGSSSPPPPSGSGVPGLSGNSAMSGLSSGSDDWDIE